MPLATHFHYNLFPSFPLLFLEVTVPQTDWKPLALANPVLKNILSL